MSGLVMPLIYRTWCPFDRAWAGSNDGKADLGDDAATRVLAEEDAHVGDLWSQFRDGVVHLDGQVLGKDAPLAKGDDPEFQRLRLDGVRDGGVLNGGVIDVGLDARYGWAQRLQFVGQKPNSDGSVDRKRLDLSVFFDLYLSSEHAFIHAPIVIAAGLAPDSV